MVITNKINKDTFVRMHLSNRADLLNQPLIQSLN